MVDATAVKTYEIEYVGDVLLEENGAAIIRLEIRPLMKGFPSSWAGAFLSISCSIFRAC